jgi:hypothetical protein
MNAGLKTGNISFKKALMFITEYATPVAWILAFQQAFDQFIEAPDTDDEVPF